MSEQTQTAAATQPVSISAAQAATMLAERRAQANQPNVSDAARTLGQRAAEARKQRTTEALAEPENPPVEEVQQVEDEQAQVAVEPQDETVTTETPTEAVTEAGPIDLGEGVKMTVDEIRESILLKADHTRRLQELAEKRKSFEGNASQKIALMDQTVELLGQRIGQPKPLSQFMKEFGDPVAAAEAFDAQQSQIQAFHAGRELAERQRAEQIQRAIEARDESLAESYNAEWSDHSKRDQDYTAISQYALKLGAKPEQLGRLTDPWMIMALHKAMKNDAVESQKSTVTQAVSKKPPVIRPGTKVSAGAAAQSQVQAAQSQLKKSGSIADAVALLQARRAVRG